MNSNRGAQAGFERALDPGMIQRGMLARKMDASFWFDDLVMEQRLLAGIKESERAARIRVIMPHMRCACLEFLSNLRMDHGDIFNRLLDTFVRQERTPTLGVF